MTIIIYINHVNNFNKSCAIWLGSLRGTFTGDDGVRSLADCLKTNTALTALEY